MKAIVAHVKGLSGRVLKAAVIYDDLDFAARAAALLERAALLTDEAMNWDVKPWRLNLLKEPSLAGIAQAEAADADLIVLVLRKIHRLPEELVDWLEHWAAHRQIQDAAVMLLFPDGDAASISLQDELKQFTGLRSLTFLNSCNMRDAGESMQFIQGLRQRRRPAQPVMPAFELFAGPPGTPRHWGINE